MRFCVIRHPDVAALGTCAETALQHHKDNGWHRVSEWRGEPADFHLPDFADAVNDLDAEPVPAADSAEAEPSTTRSSKTKEKQA